MRMETKPGRVDSHAPWESSQGGLGLCPTEKTPGGGRAPEREADLQRA